MSNWHTKTMKAFKSKTVSELKYIIKDCREALDICDTLSTEKAGQYADEIHYASMELKAREAA